MRVIVACEYSGVVRQAFAALGHDCFSADFEPAEDGSHDHYRGNCLDLIDSQPFDLMIAHPPCTYLSASGMHWTTRGLRDPKLTEDALDFVRRLMEAPIPRIALENPVGIISSRVRRPDQIIQPYQYGENASKKTCLWLKGLPLLVPTEHVAPRMVGGNPRWANQTDSGQNKLGPSRDRWKNRSRTYAGIAMAMAWQWGSTF